MTRQASRRSGGSDWWLVNYAAYLLAAYVLPAGWITRSKFVAWCYGRGYLA